MIEFISPRENYHGDTDPEVEGHEALVRNQIQREPQLERGAHYLAIHQRLDLSIRAFWLRDIWSIVPIVNCLKIIKATIFLTAFPTRVFLGSFD